MDNKQYAAGLRAIADFYEQHPEMPRSEGLYVFKYEREAFVKAVAMLVDGGKVKKRTVGSGICEDFVADRDFGGVKLSIRIPRKNLCKLISPAVYDCPESLLEDAKEYQPV